MTPQSDHLIGLTQVADLTGMGRDRIYLMMRAGLFPHRKRLAGGWSESEVKRWLRQRRLRTY